MMLEDKIVLNTAGLSTGNGWATGDVVGITTSQAGGRGSGAQLSIRDVNGVDTLYLTNVQGEEITMAVYFKFILVACWSCSSRHLNPKVLVL